jgi:MoxR-like ATPase
MSRKIESIPDVERLMAGEQYICDEELATVVFLALRMEKPLFLEGETGVGKTEVAKVLSRGLKRQLIRLQCYEGLDATTALYEWNYSKQILNIKLHEVSQGAIEGHENIFSEAYLIKRPLLQAIQREAEGTRVVLLIDELDRADAEFEAFLLELLSDFQVSIPELGTIRAQEVPVVILTSNRTREVHEALKRRCLYHWIDYPSLEKESEILETKVPGLDRRLAQQICRFMQDVRSADFIKRPGIAETLDWAEALLLLHRDHLDERTIKATEGCLFKYREDTRRFRGQISQFLRKATQSD